MARNPFSAPSLAAGLCTVISASEESNGTVVTTTSVLATGDAECAHEASHPVENGLLSSSVHVDSMSGWTAAVLQSVWDNETEQATLDVVHNANGDATLSINHGVKANESTGMGFAISVELQGLLLAPAWKGIASARALQACCKRRYCCRHV